MNYISKLLLAFCLVAGLGAATTATAQIDDDTSIRANIPYAFVVGSTQLPAGKYTIQVADDYSDLNLMVIRSDDGRTAVFFETEDAMANGTPRKGELVFNKIGNKYFLSQIFLKGDNSGNQVVESKMEQKDKAGGTTAEKHSVAGELVRAVKSVKRLG